MPRLQAKANPRRSPEEKLALAKLRTLPADEQRRALIAFSLRGRPYLREGKGVIYLNSSTSLDHPKRTIWKVGETRDLVRRQEEYRRCDRSHPHTWFFAFHVQRRLLAERIVQLSFLSKSNGGKRVYFRRRCSCGHRHREYVWFPTPKSLSDIVTIIFDSLALIGETQISVEVL
ncbi:hypothetical protein R3P38DRAFT_3171007 [Favolaschia claudopus]|uniref:GIY-YIG nuclease family protein n=1 Tax=Favolaschia claudopus TaxID=2862362 RepID=A0AAW0DM30_9AGAR